MLRIGDSSDENFPLSVGRHRQRLSNSFSRRRGAFGFQNVPAPRAPRLAHYERRLQYFWEISSYDLTPRTGKDFKREIEIGRSVLRSFRRSLPNTRITWIEGNHEFRLRKYLIQNARELYGLPGVSVPDIFDLKRLKIEY